MSRNAAWLAPPLAGDGGAGKVAIVVLLPRAVSK